MTRTRSTAFVLASGCVTSLVMGSLLLSVAAAADAPWRPNIVFILADDLGWGDLSGEGSTYYESPNIDGIARRGMRFTRGYAACQVCSPSRASILTGKTPPRHGITTWIGDAAGQAWGRQNHQTPLLPADYDRALRGSEVTLAETLREADYATFFAGKWHLGGDGSLPTDHGFQINKGGWESGGPKGGYFSPWENPQLPSGPAGESLPLRLGRETAAFIQDHSENHKDQPFLAYLSFYSVHGPIQTSHGLWSKYRDKAVAAGAANDGNRFLWDRRLSVRQVQDCPIYAGMIESMDDAVGLVLDRLDELHLTENTIICFTSDNGGVSSGDAFSTSNLPLRGGKGRQWEGGLRVPFYIDAPGLTQPGSTCAVPVGGIDWYPTLLELAGLPGPAQGTIDGVSLVPLLRGGTIADRPLFWHYPHYGNQGGEPSSIVTQDDWKLIRYHEDGRNELYNLQSDPAEQHDLSAAEPQRTVALGALLEDWLRTTEARFPMPDPRYDPAGQRARLQTLRTQGQARLERQHAGFLAEDFRPNQDWWGSELRD